MLALAGCAAPTRKMPWTAPLITVEGDQLTYRGYLIPDSARLVQAAAGAHTIKTMRIWSHGGEVGGAIDTALWVHRNGIDVIVDGPCLSSCANYIFAAGKQKHIVGQGYVGWHGTIYHRLWMHRRGQRMLDPVFLAMAEKTAEKERAFYAEVGVNGYISWFGKLAPYKVWDTYFMSAQDMAYFGLTGLHVRADYEATDLSRINARKENVRLLKVDRSVTNSLDPNWMTP